MLGLLFCLSVFGFTDFHTLFDNADPGLYKIIHGADGYTLGDAVTFANIATGFDSYVAQHCGATSPAAQCQSTVGANLKGIPQEEDGSAKCNIATASTEYEGSYLADFFARTLNTITFGAADTPSIRYIACEAGARDGKDPFNAETAIKGEKCVAATPQPLSHILPVLTAIVEKPPVLTACVPKSSDVIGECPTTCTATQTPPEFTPLFDSFGYKPIVVGVKGASLDNVKLIIENYGPVIAEANIKFENLDYSEPAADAGSTAFAKGDGLICNVAEGDKAKVWLEVVGWKDITIAEVTDTTGFVCSSAAANNDEIPAASAWILKSPYNKAAYSSDSANIPAGFFLAYQAEQVIRVTAPNAAVTDKFEPIFTNTAIDCYFIAYDKAVTLPATGSKVAALDEAGHIAVKDIPTDVKKYTELTDAQVEEPFNIWPFADVKTISQTSVSFADADNTADSEKLKSYVDCLFYNAHRHTALTTEKASFTGSLRAIADVTNGQGKYIKQAAGDKTNTLANLNVLAIYALSKNGLVDVACLKEVKPYSFAKPEKCTVTGQTDKDITYFAQGFQALYVKAPTIADLKKNIALYGPAVVLFKFNTAEWTKYSTTDPVTDETIFTPVEKADVTENVYCTILGWDQTTDAKYWIVKYPKLVGNATEPNVATTLGKIAVVADITDKVADAVHFVYVGTTPPPTPDAAFSVSMPMKVIMSLIALFVFLF